MIGNYLCDEIDIVTSTYDDDGVLTETTQTNVPCKIEEQNKVVRNENGEEQTSGTLVILPTSSSLDYQSRIRIRSRGGITQSNNRPYSIMKLGLQGGFTASHWEVYL